MSDLHQLFIHIVLKAIVVNLFMQDAIDAKLRIVLFYSYFADRFYIKYISAFDSLCYLRCFLDLSEVVGNYLCGEGDVSVRVSCDIF